MVLQSKESRRKEQAMTDRSFVRILILILAAVSIVANFATADTATPPTITLEKAVHFTAPNGDREPQILKIQLAPLPDLYLSSMRVTPSNLLLPLSWDSRIEVEFTVRNRTIAPALSSSVGIYLSTDRTRTSPCDQLWQASIGPLAGSVPGAPPVFNEVKKTVTLFIPHGTWTGSYYIIVRVDDQNAVQEMNESNNVGVQSYSVQAPLTRLPRWPIADFDGDGKADMFRAYGQRWCVSYGGTSAWQVLANSVYQPKQLAFADFNNDGKADVVRADRGQWLVSYGGTGAWMVLNRY
jgi:hypothetical protein